MRLCHPNMKTVTMPPKKHPISDTTIIRDDYEIGVRIRLRRSIEKMPADERARLLLDCADFLHAAAGQMENEAGDLAYG